MKSPLLALVISAVVLFVSIYMITNVINSIELPTVATAYSNETVNLATNDTYVNFACQAGCIGDTPEPTNCGVESTGVTLVVNTTDTLPSDLYVWTQNQIKMYTNDTYAAGNWKVTYSCYDYSVSSSGSTFQTTQGTMWNSIQLAAVSLITLAATLVLGSLFFK